MNQLCFDWECSADKGLKVKRTDSENAIVALTHKRVQAEQRGWVSILESNQ